MNRKSYIAAAPSWLFVVTGILPPKNVLAGLSICTGIKGGPAPPAMQAAVVTTLGFIGVVLTGCIAFGVILYRRSIAPMSPHHQLLEENEFFDLEGLTERNASYEM